LHAVQFVVRGRFDVLGHGSAAREAR
jgi:hypothetical protein